MFPIDFLLISIDFHWFSIDFSPQNHQKFAKFAQNPPFFITFSYILHPKSSPVSKKLHKVYQNCIIKLIFNKNGRFPLIFYRFSLIFIDFHWFSIDFDPKTIENLQFRPPRPASIPQLGAKLTQISRTNGSIRSNFAKFAQFWGFWKILDLGRGVPRSRSREGGP